MRDLAAELPAAIFSEQPNDAARTSRGSTDGRVGGDVRGIAKPSFSCEPSPRCVLAPSTHGRLGRDPIGHQRIQWDALTSVGTSWVREGTKP
jgi:hypothetical protein